MTFSKHQRLLHSRMAWSVSRLLNYTIRLTAKTLKGFITPNEVVISIYGMWIPVFTETTEPDILEKHKRKRVSCREKKPNFAKLRPVYKVQNAWELRPQ